MANSIIDLKNISKVYGTVVKTTVLHDLSMQFEEKSFNSIIGQSGSGKSTLLNIMGTLDNPTSGKVYLNNTRTDTLKSRELAKLRNRDIGFIFQFHYLLPEFTVLENVLMPYWVKKKIPLPEVVDRAKYLLDVVELSSVINNNALALSGGQQQRTAIARALLNNPKIILADEPTGNLDSDTTDTVYKLLRQLNEEFGTTFVVITHDSHVAEQTDRIVELKDGRVIMDLMT